MSGAATVQAARRRAPAAPDANRSAAWEAYLAAPLPDRVEHLWRYSEPEWFLPPRTFAVHAAREGALPAKLQKAVERGELSAAVHCRGGVPVQILVNAEAARAGLAVRPLTPGMPEADLAGLPAAKFTLLNTAAFAGGVVLDVPDGLALKAPVHILQTPGPRSPFDAVRLFIRAGRDARLTVLDEYAAAGGKAAHINSAVGAVAGDNARLEIMTVQRLGDTSTLHLTQRAQAGRGARVMALLLSLGGLRSKVDTGIVLAGEGAEAETVGLVLGKGRQRLDHHTEHLHDAPHTMSRMDFRVVLDGKSTSAYTGLIRIAKEASGADARQQNHNLLLAETARAETIPELEILTEDVQCSHGATVGPVDPEQMYYLESRGIPVAEARRMIMRGFMEPTLARIPPHLRATVDKLIDARIGSGP